MFEYLGATYLLLSVVAIVKSLFSLFVEIKSGWRKHLTVVLNVVQVLCLLMYPAILFIRFMFPVQVCFCDFESSYKASLDYYNVEINTIVPSPVSGFEQCLFTRSYIIGWYLIIHSVAYGGAFLIFMFFYIKQNFKSTQEP